MAMSMSPQRSYVLHRLSYNPSYNCVISFIQSLQFTLWNCNGFMYLFVMHVPLHE